MERSIDSSASSNACGEANAEAPPHASVIVLTRNGLPRVADCLRSALGQQAPWQFEIVAIDSGSTDGTWELLGSLPIRRFRIEPRAFNHGETRNLGASEARGAFLVFLVQDAVPIGVDWLKNLVAAAELPGVAGSYGRELPWPSDNPLVWLQMQQALPPHRERVLQRLRPGRPWEALTPVERLETASFHNTCSCIRRSVWEEHPFRPLRFGEDLDWGMRAIRSGHAIAYEPRAAVHHSHDRTSWYELKRAYADHELVARLLGYRAYPRFAGMLKGWARCTAEFLRAVWAEPRSFGEKARLTARTPVVVGARHYGSYLGAQAALHRSTFWASIDHQIRKGV